MPTTDLHDCRPNKEWLDRFKENVDEVFAAMEIWQWDVVGLVSQFGREDNARQGIIESKGPVDIPAYFSNLTELIVAWSDIFLGINAQPLMRLKRQMLALRSPNIGHGPAPKWNTFLEATLRSFDVVKRIELATAYKFPRLVSDDEEPGQPPSPGYLDLVVQKTERLISRRGWEKCVDLSKRPVLWHVFLTVYAAKGSKADQNQMRNGYPGEYNTNALGQVYFELRDQLKGLGVTVENRRLIEIPPL